MSMRDDARKWADDTLRSAVRGLVGIMERAIDLRRAQPHRFALFHGRMADLLAEAPGRVPFRKVRIATHLMWERHYSAKAYALSASLASACGLCQHQTAQGSE